VSLCEEKFANWTDAINYCADVTSNTVIDERAVPIAREAADFLQSLANMQKREPDADLFIGDDWVSRKNRDWWRNKILLNNSIKDQYIKVLEQKLAAANARIAELENYPHYANELCDAVTSGLQWLKNIRDGISTVDSALENMRSLWKHCQDEYPGAVSIGKDQPKRPLLADQPEVFDKLIEFIEAAHCYDKSGNRSRRIAKQTT